MLGFGVATEWLKVEAVLGAFVAGVVLHRSRFQHEDVIHHLEGLTNALFAPVFFATAGLQVDLRLLNNAEALWWALIVLAVAIVFKFAGAYGGARLAGRTHRAGTGLGCWTERPGDAGDRHRHRGVERRGCSALLPFR